MPRYDDGGSEPCSIGSGKVLKATEKALLFEPEDDDAFWVPKSVVHEDSEVYKEEHEGKLLVKRWWAEKEGRA